MELSQRTGQLLIIYILGRGTPVVVTLPLYGLSVKDAMAWRYAVGGWRSASLEVGGHPSSPYGLRRDKEGIEKRHRAWSRGKYSWQWAGVRLWEGKLVLNGEFS